MTDDFKIQHSINIPSGEQFEKGDMVNIRSNDPGEFLRLAQMVADPATAQALAEAAANLRAAYLVVRDMGGSVVATSQTPPQSPQVPAQAPQSPPQGNYPQPAQYAPQNGSQPFRGGQAQGYGQQPAQGGYQQQPQQQPTNGAGSPPPDAGPAPSCSHGVRTFKTGPYKNGKPGSWRAWMCPAPQGDPGQHDPVWIPNR